MEDIKFRVWDKKEQRMIRWKEICESEEFTHYYLNQEFSNTSPPMQYVGKNEKGKEIYEGDIVLIHGEICIVEFNLEKGKVAAYPIITCNFVSTADWKYMKIIGNKFDNPELKKDEQKEA